MKRNIHRLLASLPSLAIALIGLWAVADPPRASLAYAGLLAVMRHWYAAPVAVVFVLTYFGAWWITSIEPKTRRQKIVEGLRPHHTAMWKAHSALLAAEWDQLDKVDDGLQKAVEPAGKWIMANMGEAAWAAFAHPAIMSGVIIYNNPPDLTVAKQRSNMQMLSKARLEVLEKFLGSGAYDGGA